MIHFCNLISYPFLTVAKLSGNEMLGDYHPKVFHKGNSGWSCCKQRERNAPGCRPASQSDGAYFKCSLKDRPLSSHSHEMVLSQLEGKYDTLDGKCYDKPEMPTTSTPVPCSVENGSYVELRRISDSQDEEPTSPRNKMESGEF